MPGCAGSCWIPVRCLGTLITTTFVCRYYVGRYGTCHMKTCNLPLSAGRTPRRGSSRSRRMITMCLSSASSPEFRPTCEEEGPCKGRKHKIFRPSLACYRVPSLYLKGTVAWDFWSWFFLQTTPPGPIRSYLEAFLILATFHGVIQVLKTTPRRPGHRGVANSWCPGRWGVENLERPGHRGFVFDDWSSQIAFIWDTGDS